jgi:hypothetical protein
MATDLLVQLMDLADRLKPEAPEGSDKENAGVVLNGLLASRRRDVVHFFTALTDGQRNAIQPFLTVERSASDFDEDGVGDGEETVVGSSS